MFSEQILGWGKSRSCIRELAEYGAVRKAEIGAENVFDFSLGNPSIPAPPCVNDAIRSILANSDIPAHMYTTAAGILPLREKIAASVRSLAGVPVSADRVYVTCGAASSLAVTLHAILLPGDEVLVPAPFFPEYRVFTTAAGGVLRTIPPLENMQIDLAAAERAIHANTRAVLLNSPNNPSGVVYTEQTLRGLADLLRAAEQRYGHEIFLISDEPYRELVYDGMTAPCPLSFYDNAIMCYSWSKALSIPGERIGYIALSGNMESGADVYAAVMGAARSLGYVNPPSLFQRVMERCIGAHVDAGIYQANRDLLCSGLSEIGYTYIPPQGAFYLFMKALEPDAKAFSEQAKKQELLLVPSDDFGVEGYVRISYCVSADCIRKSMGAFRTLWKMYHN